MRVELLSIPDNWPQLIATAARVAYQSTAPSQEKNKALIRALCVKGHRSVLRHATAQFRISEISRTCGRQLLRHKFLDVVELSQRYVDASKLNWVNPVDSYIDPNGVITASAIVDSINTYEGLLAEGLVKEDARYVLPEAMHTQFVVTGNFQSWWDFLHLRCERHAQWEIREIAWEIFAQLNTVAPEVFSQDTFIKAAQAQLERVRTTFDMEEQT